MTPDDSWSTRRRLGATLRRWATTRVPRSSPEPEPRRHRLRCSPRRKERDRGAATILVLAIGLVLVSAGGAAAAVGAARVGRHQAQVAADLGALAGAARAIEGPGVACAQAARFVAANSGRMSSCDVEGLEIVVHADVEVTGLPGPPRLAHAAARAGPVYTF